MKISTKGRYALRLMLDLALQNTGAPVSLGEIARRQDISEKYLEQLLPALTRRGLVRSVRGAGGGYLLTRPPEEYTVGEILRAQEGSLAPVDCVEGGCRRERECGTVELWRRIDRAVADVVDAVTLQDLVNDYRAKRPAEGG